MPCQGSQGKRYRASAGPLGEELKAGANTGACVRIDDEGAELIVTPKTPLGKSKVEGERDARAGRITVGSPRPGSLDNKTKPVTGFP